MADHEHPAVAAQATAASEAGDRPLLMSGRTLSGVAMEIRRCLAVSPPDRHEALRWVAQFVSLFERASPSARPAMVVDEPEPTADARWDALLAGTAEHLCFHHGVAVPDWSVAPTRFLANWWFVSPYRSVHASALVSTPAALANRGVFIHADSLASV